MMSRSSDTLPSGPGAGRVCATAATVVRQDEISTPRIELARASAAAPRRAANGADGMKHLVLKRMPGHSHGDGSVKT